MAITVASIRFLARVLVALVALYAANDGLLQPFSVQGDGFAIRQDAGHAAMPVLVSQAAENDQDISPAPGRGAAAPVSHLASGLGWKDGPLTADGPSHAPGRPRGAGSARGPPDQSRPAA